VHGTCTLDGRGNWYTILLVAAPVMWSLGRLGRWENNIKMDLRQIVMRNEVAHTVCFN
jgi:hypothetical protein